VTWDPVEALDNSCGDVTITEASGHKPGDQFKAGTYEVLYTARDHVGLTDTCQFTIQIKDVTAPVWAGCPTRLTGTTVDTFQNTHVAVVTWPEVKAEDNSAATITYGEMYNKIVSGMAFPPGTTKVKYSAKDDSGNEALCEFDIRVVDKQKPKMANQLHSFKHGDEYALAYEQCGGKWVEVLEHSGLTDSNEIANGPQPWIKPTQCLNEAYNCTWISDSFSRCMPKEITADPELTSTKFRVRNLDSNVDKYQVMKFDLFEDCGCNNKIESIVSRFGSAEQPVSGLPYLNTLRSGDTDCKEKVYGTIDDFSASNDTDKLDKILCAQYGVILRAEDEVRCIKYQDAGAGGSQNTGTGSEKVVFEVFKDGEFKKAKQLNEILTTAAVAYNVHPGCTV